MCACTRGACAFTCSCARGCAYVMMCVYYVSLPANTMMNDALTLSGIDSREKRKELLSGS